MSIGPWNKRRFIVRRTRGFEAVRGTSRWYVYDDHDGKDMTKPERWRKDAQNKADQLEKIINAKDKTGNQVQSLDRSAPRRPSE